MNPDLKPIFARRSVRQFQNADIPDGMVRNILEAAMAAPSAVAKDPWHFIVVRSAALRNRIADFLPNGQMLRSAPLGIVVCGDIERAHDRQESYLLQDCSAAIQNILLAASMLGLGACWLGVHPRKERIEGVRKLFATPPSIVPVAVIAIGRPAEHPAPRTRYRQEAVHEEKW